MTRVLKKPCSGFLFPKKNSLSVGRPRCDPFESFSSQSFKGLAIKPTCHKTAGLENKSEKKAARGLKMKKIKICFSEACFKDPKFVKLGTGSFLRAEKIKKIDLNPMFCLRGSEAKGAGVADKALGAGVFPDDEKKFPAFQRKMIKRVNTVVFKERRYKSALDFSFANPYNS